VAVKRFIRRLGEVGLRGARPARTALWLLGEGLWPVLISPVDDPVSPSPGKAPVGRGWGLTRPSPDGLREAYRRHPRAGVGLLLGPGGGVVDLEVDDPEGAAPVLGRLFPGGPPETIGWRSARGEHRLFAWDERLPGVTRSAVVTLSGGALEVRLGGGGKQVVTVCPPSPGAVALTREAELVRSAAAGTRNSTLNRAAFNLGQLVAGGVLSRVAVERELTEAAHACGLPEGEACASIRSGLGAGERLPRAAGAPC
jgi:hypothetical protein